MAKLISFIKREAVLSISIVLAVASAFFVPPDKAYIDYIDFRTLGILFCLMCVMAGLDSMGVFSKAAKSLIAKTKNTRQMVLILVLLCFFFSMVITNDVALITFVPLAIIMLGLAGDGIKSRWLIFTVVMQTVAANLGSMLTPIGNPQNLYLYGLMGISFVDFSVLMLPYAAISLLLIVGITLFATRKESEKTTISSPQTPQPLHKLRLIIYIALFALSLLVVVHISDWLPVCALTLATLLVFDRNIILKVDYSLLATFVALFIFIGNLGRIDVFRSFLESIITGKELITAVVCSQVTSNVPAALLLSGFTDKLGELTVGVNIGGLGTIIASMASLISFKYIAKEWPDKKFAYLGSFTLYNICFLLALLAFTVVMP